MLDEKQKSTHPRCESCSKNQSKIKMYLFKCNDCDFVAKCDDQLKRQNRDIHKMEKTAR